MSKHEFAIGILREKIQFYMDEWKKILFTKETQYGKY